MIFISIALVGVAIIVTEHLRGRQVRDLAFRRERMEWQDTEVLAAQYKHAMKEMDEIKRMVSALQLKAGFR